ncbi:MAG: histidine kinase dimerization/phospho-acceptor domain-containing protein [Ktedonobacteraceae bacterium]
MAQEQTHNQEYPPFLHIDEEKFRPNKESSHLLATQVLEREQLLEAALEMAGLGVWKLTFGTGEVDFSARGKAHLGFSAETALNYALLDERIISAVDSAGKVMAGERQIVQDMLKNVQEQREYHREYQVRWPDGSIHWIAASGRGFYSKNGKPDGIVGVTRDITEIKQEEQSKEAFLSMTRHELKTPLTIIKGFAQLLRRQMKKLGLDEQAETLVKIEAQVDALTNSINKLKDTSNIQS